MFLSIKLRRSSALEYFEFANKRAFTNIPLCGYTAWLSPYFSDVNTDIYAGFWLANAISARRSIAKYSCTGIFADGPVNM